MDGGWIRSSHHPFYNLSGQVVRSFYELHDEVCDFLRLSHAAGGDLIQEHFMLLIREKSVHLCINGPTGDGVHLDAGGGEFFCEGHGETVDAAFCGGVGRLAGSAADAPDGGDIDDLSAVVVDHSWNRQLRAVEDGGQVCGENPVPILEA